MQNGCKKWLGCVFLIGKYNASVVVGRWREGGGGIFLYVYLLFNLLTTGPNWNKLAGFAGWIQEIVFGLTNLRNSCGLSKPPDQIEPNYQDCWMYVGIFF